jgi:hypothetical protein
MKGKDMNSPLILSGITSQFTCSATAYGFRGQVIVVVGHPIRGMYS